MSQMVPAGAGEAPVNTGGAGGGLLRMLTPMAAKAMRYSGEPAPQTGIKQLVQFSKAQGLLNKRTLFAMIPELQGIFGGYPENNNTEKGLDGLFIALFGVLCITFFVMWGINTARRQNFHIFLGCAVYCVLKVIGFALRLVFAGNASRVEVGVASVVFIQVAPLLLLALNTVLAHRIFIWRHPEIGHHRFFVHFLNSVYLIVICIIVMAIIGESLPFVYFLSQHHYNICKNVMKAASILNLFFASMSLLMLLTAYALPVGTMFTHSEQGRDIPLVYQASWITSAHLFYYPRKPTSREHIGNDRGEIPIRVIPSREAPGHGHHHVGDQMNPSAPQMHWATLTVVCTSLALILNVCIRVAACFYTGPWGELRDGQWKVFKWVQRGYVMFIFYGAVEIAVIVMYLLMRIDLRFYIPDRSRKPLADMDTRANVEKESTEHLSFIDTEVQSSRT